MEILGDFDKSYRGNGSLTGVGKKGTGADKVETLSGKQLFPRSLKLTFKQNEGLIIGVTRIREEQTGPKVQTELLVRAGTSALL